MLFNNAFIYIVYVIQTQYFLMSCQKSTNVLVIELYRMAVICRVLPEFTPYELKSSSDKLNISNVTYDSSVSMSLPG